MLDFENITEDLDETAVARHDERWDKDDAIVRRGDDKYGAMPARYG